MVKWLFVAVVMLGIVAASCTGSLEQASTAPPVPLPDGQSGTVAIVDVDVFDGTAMIRQTTVVIEDGLILAVGAATEVPADAEILEGAGRTLMPGLIDAHTHTFADAGLQRTVQFGVTTHLDMFTDPDFLESELAAEIQQAQRPQADLFSSSVLGTVPDGHGTQLGFDIPTMSGPDDTAAWVQDRVDDGASFIKLVLEDGARFGQDFPTLDQATFRAAVRELSLIHI